MLCIQDSAYDWVYVLRNHADIIFDWLVRKDDTVLPIKLPVNGVEVMYHGMLYIHLVVSFMCAKNYSSF